MALRAIRNTYGFEGVGYGIERRLLIIAGQVVPPSVRLEDPTAVADDLAYTNAVYLEMRAAPYDAPGTLSASSAPAPAAAPPPAPTPAAPAPTPAPAPAATPATAPAAPARRRGPGGQFLKREDQAA